MGQQARKLVDQAAVTEAREPQSQRRVTIESGRVASLVVGVSELKERGRSLEVFGIVALSAVLHAGAAYGFYTSEKAPPERRLSKVDIEFVRPSEPEPPKPEPPQPPPPEEPVQQKQVVKRAVVAEPEPTPPPTPQVVDTGIEAEASEDGNLLARKGGTGIAPTPPLPPPAPPAPVAVAPPPVIAAHEGANYAKNPRPAYPSRAKREGWQGKVVLRVQILPTGRAGQIAIQTSAGRQMLDDAAAAAVRGWTFVPARRGGVPVSGWVNVPIEFRLK